MKQLAEYIFRQIERNTNANASKHVFRIEGFEDLNLYARICELTSEHFGSSQFIAKLSRIKYEQLKDASTYAANLMTQHGWVDFDDRMTYYRNLVPAPGEHMIILLMGTDVVADKGGLSDFFAITPYSLDQTIGDRISDLMGDDLRHVVFGDSETVPKICDAFFKALFECVPRNLAKVSAMMDEWESEMPTPQELIAELFHRLPEWGIPRIDEAAKKITPAKLTSGKKENKILNEASQFIKGKTFARVTRATQGNVAAKFQKYREKPGRFAVDYPAGQAAESLDELEQAVMDFIAGDRGKWVMRTLIETDFSILSEVLSIKMPRKQTVGAIILRGDPLIAFCSAIMQLLSSLDEDAPLVHTIRIKLEKACMSSVPSKSNSDGDDWNALLLEAWNRVAIFAGGVFSFINRERWELEKDSPLLIESVPENFTDPIMAAELFRSSLLTNCTGNMHKIEFSVSALAGSKVVDELDFCWKIDPQEDWMIAFSHLPQMAEFGNSYIPYAVMPRLNAAFSIRDEDSFAYFIEHETFSLPEGQRALIDQMRASVSSAEDEQNELGKFSALGMTFMNFVNAILTRGFYSVADGEVLTLIREYVKLAEHIATSPIYAGKLRHCVRYFANAFTICSNSDPLTADIYVSQAIVPPYHPASLEKISDRMVFVRTGLREWFSQNTQSQKSPNDVIDRLTSLSRIHNATDAFLFRSDAALTCGKAFGYYTLYGKAQQSSSFVSAQDIQRREMVFEDDFDDKQLSMMTREAKALLRVIEQYMETYPRRDAQLTISFINPTDLQTVVSALHKFVTDRKKSKYDTPFRLSLTIVIRSEMYGARAYLSYWINSAFSKDDKIDVKAYIRLYDDEQKIPSLIPEATDLIFLFDAMNTQKDASYSFRPRDVSDGDIMMDCRFPMVFKPTVTASNSKIHTIGITQWQFQAATAHTQVLRAYQNGYANDRQYELQQSSSLDTTRGAIIQELQQCAIWLTCIDDAIDRRSIRALCVQETGGWWRTLLTRFKTRDLYPQDAAIIGFTTGEGSFGQMNLAITGKPELKIDLKDRCKRRLRLMFKGWDDEKLTTASENCIEKARELDGVSLLRAMNPHDYSINSYMAYLVANALCIDSKRQLNVLINLDSYRHWFIGDRGEDSLIPDFLLLSADIAANEPLRFHAVVIEAKLSKLCNMPSHLAKAERQLDQGLKQLQHHFDPRAGSIEHRYWLAQLYRAIVFLLPEMNYSDGEFRRLTSQLDQMLENHYSISWSGRILAMELDSPRYLEIDHYDQYECWHVGQLAFQNILLKRDINGHADYEEDIAVDENDEYRGETHWADEIPGSIDFDEGPIDPVPGPLPAASIDVPSPEVPMMDPTANKQDSHPSDPAEEPTPPEDFPTDNSPEEHTSEEIIPLSAVRVPIGTDKAGKMVYWEFGNPGLANRHLLITGSSGQGKTYAIQAFLYELVKQKISSVVFDYTDGFLEDKLEPRFSEALAGKLEQHVAILDHIPIDPFRRQTLSVAGRSMLEPSTMAAGRFAAIMKHVYGFGEQQYSALYDACKQGIDRFGEKMNFRKMRELLDADGSTYSKTVLSKMRQLFDLDLFDVEHALDWTHLTEREGKVCVIQLTNLDREIQTVLTEALMWDAWYSLTKSGDKDRPFVVVLDEAQNLSFADGSPAQKILQEGRKYGWSAWFATQFLKGALSSDEISRLQQASEVLYFKPSGEETAWVGQQLADANMSAANWTQIIKNMQKGHCIVQGGRVGRNGEFEPAPPTMVKVSSFESRD